MVLFCLLCHEMWQLTRESSYSSKVNADFSLATSSPLQSRDSAQISWEDLNMNLDYLKKNYNKIILNFCLGKIHGFFLCSVPSKKARQFYIMYLRNHRMFTWAHQHPSVLGFGMLCPSCEFSPKSLCHLHLIGQPLLKPSLQPLLAKPLVEKNPGVDFCLTIYRFYVKNVCTVISKDPVEQGLGHGCHLLLANLLLLAKCSSNLNTEFLRQTDTSMKEV